MITTAKFFGVDLSPGFLLVVSAAVAAACLSNSPESSTEEMLSDSAHTSLDMAHLSAVLAIITIITHRLLLQQRILPDAPLMWMAFL